MAAAGRAERPSGSHTGNEEGGTVGKKGGIAKITEVNRYFRNAALKLRRFRFYNRRREDAACGGILSAAAKTVCGLRRYFCLRRKSFGIRTKNSAHGGEGAAMKKEIEKILGQVGRVVIGKEEVTKKLLAAMLAGGHVLLEDVPGTGKTRLARTLAASLGVEFGRIQFTPDMLPADVTGLHIYNRETGRFELKKGPVFTNILLADEINRATPRTQAGLLECMEERQVTIDGNTSVLAEPFFVIATQNPVETAGTFPLPEAQTDRFMVKLSMGMPQREEEMRILAAYSEGDPLTELKAVMDGEEVVRLKEETRQVYVHPLMAGYLTDLASATRKQERVVMGVSPRGTLALMRCCKALACMEDRDYVTPEDAKLLAPCVLAHRLVFSSGRSRQEEAEKIIGEILEKTPVPMEDFGRR